MSDCLKIKDPNAVLDYSINWADYLEAGETISSSTWFLMPSSTDVALSSMSSSTESGGTATVTVTGGLVPYIYRLVNRIVTSESRTDDRTITLRVEHE